MAKPKILSTETVFRGRVFDLKVSEINEHGVTYKREIIAHPGSAVIVPLFSDNSIAFVRQYRHAASEDLIELPAGALEKDEDPLDGAARELEEEIGVRAGSFEKLCEFYVSPGFLAEKMYVYLARDLIETAQDLDDDEFLNVERIALTRAVEMAEANMIIDAKTLIGIQFTASRLGFVRN